MRDFHHDEGIVLKKYSLLNGILRITIFSKNSGKIVLSGFGVKKIISRRLSHLETGNLIKYSYAEKDGHYTLGETELISAFSKIKKSHEKLDILYQMFIVLNTILPELEKEEDIYNATLGFIKKLHNEGAKRDDVEHYMTLILEYGGFLDDKTKQAPAFDVVRFAEEIIDKKLDF